MMTYFFDCPMIKFKYCHKLKHHVGKCHLLRSKGKTVKPTKDSSLFGFSSITATTYEGNTTLTISDRKALLKQVIFAILLLILLSLLLKVIHFSFLTCCNHMTPNSSTLSTKRSTSSILLIHIASTTKMNLTISHAFDSQYLLCFYFRI